MGPGCPITAGMHTIDTEARDALGSLSGPVRDWFAGAFPEGPTPAQRLAWPPIAAGEHMLLVSPTGTGKTLAGFLAILDRLFRRHAEGTLSPGLRCVYISPLRSLGYDIERNLAIPLAAIERLLGCGESPIRVGVRTGDTSAYFRRQLRDQPPHILITTPESLSLLLSQASWGDHWRGVEHVIVDEVHALVPTKRGADLAVSLERLSAQANRDPCRVGLSATCRPAEPVARFLVGPTRTCRVVEAPLPRGTPPMEIEVEALLEAGEAPHRGLTYRRLIRRLRQVMRVNRTTVIFANTRPFTEKITHDLRHDPKRRDACADGEAQAGESEPAVAAHHSALDASRRRAVESLLKQGRLKAVVTSTSLELGVDIGTADLSVQVGLPGGVARCVQRVGRSGHRLGAASRGLILAATAAEIAGAVVTARAARAGRLEPLRMVEAPLDVVCQQLLAMACAGNAPSSRPSRCCAGQVRWPGWQGTISTPASTFWPAIWPRRRVPTSPSPARPRAGPHPGSGSATAGSGFVAAASCAGSGRMSARSPRKRPRRFWSTAWQSAHSRAPMPSGWFPATGSCSMAVPWNSVAATDWSFRLEQEGPSQGCRSGTAIASRSRRSWPTRLPSSAPREPGG